MGVLHPPQISVSLTVDGPGSGCCCCCCCCCTLAPPLQLHGKKSTYDVGDMIVHYYGRHHHHHHHRGRGLGGIFARIFGRIASKVVAKTAIRSVGKVARRVATSSLKAAAKKALPAVRDAGISIAKEAGKFGAQKATEAVQRAAQKAESKGVPPSVVRKISAVAQQGIRAGSEELKTITAGAKAKGNRRKTTSKRKRPSSSTVASPAVKRRRFAVEGVVPLAANPVPSTAGLTALSSPPVADLVPRSGPRHTTSGLRTRKRTGPASKSVKPKRRRRSQPKTQVGVTQALINSL